MYDENLRVGAPSSGFNSHTELYRSHVFDFATCYLRHHRPIFKPLETRSIAFQQHPI